MVRRGRQIEQDRRGGTDVGRTATNVINTPKTRLNPQYNITAPCVLTRRDTDMDAVKTVKDGRRMSKTRGNPQYDRQTLVGLTSGHNRPQTGEVWRGGISCTGVQGSLTGEMAGGCAYESGSLRAEVPPFPMTEEARGETRLGLGESITGTTTGEGYRQRAGAQDGGGGAHDGQHCALVGQGGRPQRWRRPPPSQAKVWVRVAVALERGWIGD